MNGDASTANDVWGSLSNIASQVISYKRDVALAKLSNARVTTTSTPSGKTDSVTVNPFPGTQGAYPQAEAKPQPGASAFGVSLSSPILLMLAFGLMLVLFVMRR